MKSLVQSVTLEAGGLSTRATPVNWKQAHGSIGNQQATFYAQVRTLVLQLEKDYGCIVDTSSPLFPWVVKHAQWTLNRYLEHSDGKTSFERRWGRKYNQAICNFAETVLFRMASHNTKKPAQRGLKLSGSAKTQGDEHVVATSDGVRKARSVRRLPPSQQRDATLLPAIKAMPWDPKGQEALYHAGKLCGKIQRFARCSARIRSQGGRAGS